MGLLDSIIGDVVGGNASGTASPIASVLSGLLGGGQIPGTATSGGLGSLVSQFESAGLGHLAQSWIGNGPNQTVSPHQLQSVFGEQQIQGMARQAGMQPQDLLSQLSQHLPNVVNSLTPNGQLPAEGSMSV